MPRIAIDDLLPNDWNPNVLPDKHMTALVNDLRQRKARNELNPHPVLVAKIDGELVIVDGEWTWRAAKIAGYDEVHYELIDGDGWELRRMTIVSNTHGKNDPVKFGRLIRGMLDARPDKTYRDVADELKVSLGTISNRLDFARLADLAAKDPRYPSEGEIAHLTVRKVRELLEHGPGGALAAAEALAEAAAEEEAAEEDAEGEAQASDPAMARARQAYEEMSPGLKIQFLAWAVAEAKRKGVSEAPQARPDGAAAAPDHREGAGAAASPPGGRAAEAVPA